MSEPPAPPRRSRGEVLKIVFWSLVRSPVSLAIFVVNIAMYLATVATWVRFDFKPHPFDTAEAAFFAAMNLVAREPPDSGLLWLVFKILGASGGKGVAWMVVLDRFGALDVERLHRGEWWRLLSCTFLHAGFLHIGINMMAFAQLGPPLERLFGRARYLLLYFAGGIAASATSACIGGGPSVGASGAILALAGAIMSFVAIQSGSLRAAARDPIIRSLSFSIGLMLVLGIALSGSFVRLDNAAHAGGFIFGLILGAGFTLARRSDRRGRLLAALCFYVAISGASVAAALAATRTSVAVRLGLPTISPLRRFAVEVVLGAQADVPLPDRNLGWLASSIAELSYDRSLPDAPSGMESSTGALYIIGGEYELARVELERAVAFAPKDAVARARLGLTRGLQGDLAGAKADLEQALALDGSLHSARGHLALVLFDLGEKDRAHREKQLYLQLAAPENEKRILQAVQKIP